MEPPTAKLIIDLNKLLDCAQRRVDLNLMLDAVLKMQAVMWAPCHQFAKHKARFFSVVSSMYAKRRVATEKIDPFFWQRAFNKWRLVDSTPNKRFGELLDMARASLDNPPPTGQFSNGTEYTARDLAKYGCQIEVPLPNVTFSITYGKRGFPYVFYNNTEIVSKLVGTKLDLFRYAVVQTCPTQVPVNRLVVCDTMDVAQFGENSWKFTLSISAPSASQPASEVVFVDGEPEIIVHDPGADFTSWYNAMPVYDTSVECIGSLECVVVDEKDSNICPLSGMPIEHPVVSLDCPSLAHKCDARWLLEFKKSCKQARFFACAVCGKPIVMSRLRRLK